MAAENILVGGNVSSSIDVIKLYLLCLATVAAKSITVNFLVGNGFIQAYLYTVLSFCA